MMMMIYLHNVQPSYAIFPYVWDNCAVDRMSRDRSLWWRARHERFAYDQSNTMKGAIYSAEVLEVCYL